MIDTTDPHLESWVESANDPASDFPVQNLPFGIFRRAGTHEMPRVGVAIDPTNSGPARPSETFAAVTTTASSNPSVSTAMCRLRPFTFLPPS